MRAGCSPAVLPPGPHKFPSPIIGSSGAQRVGNNSAEELWLLIRCHFQAECVCAMIGSTSERTPNLGDPITTRMRLLSGDLAFDMASFSSACGVSSWGRGSAATRVDSGAEK